MLRLKSGPQSCAPDCARTALIMLDIINDFDFEQGDVLLNQASAMADRLAELKAKCREVGIPAIYVNDHFGRWRSDFSALVGASLKPSFKGRDIVKKLLPEEQDYFVFKPMHSAFYQTTLELLLRHLEAKNLLITGLASNICVLCTANDAHMRGYRLWLPRDTMAAASQEEQDYAELHFRKVLSADVRSAQDIPLYELSQSKSMGAELSR